MAPGMLRSFSAKTITGTKFLSLIDLPGYKVREWFLVYHWRHAHVWWGKWLKQNALNPAVQMKQIYLLEEEAKPNPTL